MTATIDKQKEPVEVIDKIVHQRILADMERFCEIANVPASFVRNSMRTFCTDNDVEFVRQFNVHRQKGESGYVIEGSNKTETRCMAIAGTLVRHFIDARIMSMNSVIGDPTTAMEPSLLLIPNFYMESYGKQLTAWQVQTVYDVLLNRHVANKLTVVGVDSLAKMATAYGPMFEEHINNFIRA